MSDAAAIADAVARLRAARELWIELDTPPRRAVRLPLPGWVERAHMAQMPRVEFLQALLGRVDAWRGFTAGDARAQGPDAAASLPFSAELWQLLLDDNAAWPLTIVDAYSLANGIRADRSEAVAGN